MKATRRRPTSPLQVLALALVLAGGIGSLLVVAQTSQDAEIGGGAWALVAVVGWWFPLIAAGLLIIVAMFGLLLAATAALVSQFEPGIGSPGPVLFWEFLLPVVCVVLFVGAHRQRMGPDSIL
jgi:NADH:ubiquinone oxidoreductase subunit 6 (subunit J)